jgi:hypothetical protein
VSSDNVEAVISESCPWEFSAVATVYKFLLDDEEADRIGLYVGGGEVPWYVGYVAGSSGF